MKRVLILLSMLLAMASTVSAEYVLVSDTDYGESGDISWVATTEFVGADGADGINGVDGTNGIDGVDGVDGTNGTDGTNGEDGADGTDGINADNSEIYSLLNKQEASSAALSSVELNPDHEGLSMSLGLSQASGVAAGAVGVMYVQKVGTTNIGYNLKAYNAEGGYNGVSGGVTIGW